MHVYFWLVFWLVSICATSVYHHTSNEIDSFNTKLSLFILLLFYVVYFSLCSRINRIGFIVSRHIHKLLYAISDQNGICFIHYLNRIDGVMVSMLASIVVDRGFEPRSCQTKDYKIGIYCFSAKHVALRRRAKTGWFGISIMCPSGTTGLSADCCFSELAL